MRLNYLALHGRLIAYRMAGSGPALILLHGMAGDSATWRHVLPALANDFTVIAPDLLGHGRSAKPRADYSLGAYASGVRDLMTALDLERATIVGQSFGGGVAMQLAYQFPERCERLVLVGSGGLGTEVNGILRALSVPGLAYALSIGCRPALRDAGARVLTWLERLGVGARPGAVEVGRAYASLSNPEVRRAFLLTLRSVVDHLGQRVSARDLFYLTSEIPTLIVWGEQDPIIPVAHAHEAHEAIRGSRLELFPGVGHFPHCEDPACFVRVLTEFIRSTPPAAVSSERWRELLLHAAARPPGGEDLAPTAPK